jgi:urease accessory protein
MTGASPLALAIFLTAAVAHAHDGAAAGVSFIAGFSHPFGGIDHVLAMVAVGRWAAKTGGRILWLVPVAFVATMAAGALLARWGLPLPLVEAGILASVVALAVLLVWPPNWPPAWQAALVAFFALFHGHAHGSEVGGAALLPYGLGFIAATAMLHLAGIALVTGVASFVNLRQSPGVALSSP